MSEDTNEIAYSFILATSDLFYRTDGQGERRFLPINTPTEDTEK